MKKNMLKVAVLISSMALSTTSAFAATAIDGANPITLGGAKFTVSTGVTLSVASLPTTGATFYGVVGKHLSGDTVYVADSLLSTTRIEPILGAKSPTIVGKIPSALVPTLVPAVLGAAEVLNTDGSVKTAAVIAEPAKVTVTYTLAVPAT